MPHQIPPEGDWFLWLLMAGRGAGKTDAMAHYVNEHALGPACDAKLPGGHRIGIVAPTLGDAADACINGPSGLKAHNPSVELVQRAGGQYVLWPNGAVARLFSTDDARSVDRLRAGGNRCLDWWEELAAWPFLDEGYDQAILGLRLGTNPRAVASTTPKNRKKLRELVESSDTVLRRATTADNPHLAERWRARLETRYAGTRLGRQELGGEMIFDVAGALFNRDHIEMFRTTRAPQQQRIVVGVDPSGGGNAQGIVIAGVGIDGRGYVFEDRTVTATPEGWGRVVTNAYHAYRANYVVAEVNYGGDMVSHVISTIDPRVPVKVVHASRGKAQRAEPVAALMSQGKISHVGRGLEKLEDELCTWEPGVSNWSPNRLDAYVWAFTELLVDGGQPFATAVGGSRPIVQKYAVR